MEFDDFVNNMRTLVDGSKRASFPSVAMKGLLVVVAEEYHV